MYKRQTPDFIHGGAIDPVKAAEHRPMLLVVYFLMIVGFGCKAGMMPMQAWLPAAHPVAPAPASAVLSGEMCIRDRVCIAALYVLDCTLPSGHMLFTVLRKSAIYALVAVSMNLLNGFTGLFSLGQAGFMLIGAYTYAIFTIPLEAKEKVYQYYDCAVGFSLPVPVAQMCIRDRKMSSTASSACIFCNALL